MKRAGRLKWRICLSSSPRVRCGLVHSWQEQGRPCQMDSVCQQQQPAVADGGSDHRNGANSMVEATQFQGIELVASWHVATERRQLTADQVYRLMIMRILITGASGLLGLNLALELCRQHPSLGRLTSMPCTPMPSPFCRPISWPPAHWKACSSKPGPTG